MKLNELPQEIQDKMRDERKSLVKTWHRNDPYYICFVNEDGTRYFEASRHCYDWSNDRGAYMPFGGGSYWTISYGKIKWKSYTDLGETCYKWVCSSETFGKAANGTEIPKRLDTKKEVLAVAKAIGIFNV